MLARGKIRSRPQPGAGGGQLQGGLINFMTEWEMGWFPKAARWQPLLLMSPSAFLSYNE